MTADRIKALEDALRNIRELNETGTDENGHRWANSDLIEQEIVFALAASQPAPQVQPGAPVTLTYTNYRGETAERRIIPRRVWWGSTEWHPEPQWLLTAFDVDKGSERDFALKDFGQPAQPVAVKVKEGYRVDAFDLKIGGRHVPLHRAIELQPLTVQDAARVVLDAVKSGLDPFDCSVLVIEAMAVKHAGNRGDAVIQLEIADEFFKAALRAIAEGRA